MKTQQIKRRGGILPSAGKAFLASLLTLALVFTTIFQFGSLWSDEEQNTANAATYTGAWEGNDAPTPLQADQDPPANSYLPSTYAWPYPWSKNDEATGNWVADSYGLSAADAELFEPVTVDRLADVLTLEGGKYYILFATPRSQAGQRLVSSVSALAKNAGTNKPKKIYLFNPVIDDYQIDITTTGAVANWSGANNHTVGGTWTYLKGLLASGGAVKEGQNVFDFGSYTADGAVLFSTTQDAPTLSDTNKDDPLTKYRYVSAAAVLTPGGLATGPNAAEIGGVFNEFSGGGSDVRTDLDFARRFWNAGVNDFNYNNNGVETAARIGRADINLFPISEGEREDLSSLNEKNVDVYTADNFKLEFVDFVEGFNRLNKAINDDAYLNYAFATIGCHNSQAYISEIAKKAKAKNQAVYVNDDTLDGSFRFGSTVATAGVKNSAANQGSTANGWLVARNAYNFSYLYGHTIEYLGDKAISKNETYKNNSIQYYYNGSTGSGFTADTSKRTAPRTGFSGYNADALAAAPAGNAVRLQIPFIFAFNGGADAASAVVPDNQFLHRKVTDDGRYSEYMMELSTVWGSDAAKNSTNNSSLTTDEIDGYDLSISGSAVKYAQEGRDYSLNNIFDRARTPEPTDLFVETEPPTPVITGASVKPGSTVGLITTGWPQQRTAFSGTATRDIPSNAGIYTLAAPTNVAISFAEKSGYVDTGKTITGTATLPAGNYVAGTVPTANYSYIGLAGYALSATAAVSGQNLRITFTAKRDDAKTNLIVQWKVAGEIVKEGPINATNGAYKIATADAGKELTVSIKGTGEYANPIYTLEAIKTSVAKTVALNTLKSATPTISGKTNVGSTLTANPGAWTAGTKLTYQWFAGNAKIGGRTANKLKLTSAQKGKTITVKVTGTKATYETVTKTSKATAKVTLPVLKTATPKISGKAKVGKKLTAKPGSWTAGTKFTYQWFANGKKIAKATKKTFKLTKKQKGKKITVKVTGKKTSYTTASKTSKPTAKVKK